MENKKPSEHIFKKSLENSTTEILSNFSLIMFVTLDKPHNLLEPHIS